MENEKNRDCSPSQAFITKGRIKSSPPIPGNIPLILERNPAELTDLQGQTIIFYILPILSFSIPIGKSAIIGK